MEDQPDRNRVHRVWLVMLVLGVVAIGGAYRAVVSAEQKQIAASAAAAAKREAEISPIRDQARAELETLRHLREEGKTIENIRLTATREGNAVRLTVYNQSEFPLRSVVVEIVDTERRKKFRAERYNGVRMEEMPDKMRPEWLRTTGYYGIAGRVLSESHIEVTISGPIPARYYKQVVPDLPETMWSARELSYYVNAAIDESGASWWSPVDDATVESRANIK